MLTEEITIRVDAAAAKLYREASEQDRLKFDLWLNLHLKDAIRSLHSREMNAPAVEEAKNDQPSFEAIIAKLRELRRGNTLGKDLTIPDLIDESRRF